MLEKSQFKNTEKLRDHIKVARGQKPCDLLIKNGIWLDVYSGVFQSSDIAIYEGIIVGTGQGYKGHSTFDAQKKIIVPGFIDSHVHIESSMMTPARFQQSVLPCGTTTCIWDPHEIANVQGKAGIQWALDAIKDLLIDIFIMVPSCVPSTNPGLAFETSGAELTSADLMEFREHPKVLGLAEMMDFPGLLNTDQEVLNRVHGFQSLKRDGHCPGLSGQDLNAYGVAGIHSCHESTTLKEAREKLSKGIHVLIREGSCARDATTLAPIINPHSSSVIGFCSDDRNPLDIAETGHINHIAHQALCLGHDPVDVFRSASFGAAQIFGLHDRGAVAPGMLADLVILAPDSKGWQQGFKICRVYKNGEAIKDSRLKEQAKAHPIPKNTEPNMNLSPVKLEDFQLEKPDTARVSARVIGVIPGKILTENLTCSWEGNAEIDTKRDLLKISVFERHHNTGFHTTGFVKGFGLKEGAIALSINHDSHNIITVGAHEKAMVAAVNDLIKIDGGIVVTNKNLESQHLKLPLAGLMTDSPPEIVAAHLKSLKKRIADMGCALDEPFLQLSFLALPVIPSLKITDRGLIDVEKFEKVAVFL